MLRPGESLVAKLLFLPVLVVLGIAGCGNSDNPASHSPVAGACPVDEQKQFVLDAMRDVYYWNDLLPESVDLDAYATPEALLEDLIAVQPLDNFSYIDLLATDSQFFNEGQYEGFGFSSRFESPDDLRLLSVFSGSPAADAGFVRGQRIVMLNGRTVADIEANEGVGELFALASLEFTVRRPDDTEFVVTVDKNLVTIDPVPVTRTIDLPGGNSVGYLLLTSFIGTAHATFATVFADFAEAGVTDVIVDLRYNGGGRVDTAELLGDYLGGVANSGMVFSKTQFNDNNSLSNRTALFEQPAASINLSSLVVIATDRTASASELVTNSMFPYANVSIVGSPTLGKPVGQLGIQFCDKILRPTAFETLNANDEGGYFGGLPANCPVADDLLIPVGDDLDPNLVTALYLLENGACPTPPVATAERQKPSFSRYDARELRHRPVWQKLAGAY